MDNATQGALSGGLLMNPSDDIRTCSQCLLPETFPATDIDHSGQCVYCRDYRPFQPRGEDALREKLLSRRGDTYDVVVPFSGGKDSTYALWYASQVLELRTIAVNYDSGLQSDFSKENMRVACERLHVPWVVKTVSWRRQLTMLRSILRIAESVDCFFHVCGNCENGIRTAAVSVARDHRVPFILHGDDPLREPSSTAAFTGSRAFLSKLVKRKRAIPRVAFHLTRYVVNSGLQQAEMGLPLRHCVTRPLRTARWPDRGAEVVHFYQYVPWDPMSAIRIIKEHAGWKSPQGKDSRFDCRVHCFGNKHWIQEVGLSNDGFKLSALLRAGLIDKKKRIDDESQIQNHVDEECRSVIEDLGLHGYR